MTSADAATSRFTEMLAGSLGQAVKEDHAAEPVVGHGSSTSRT